LDSKKLDSEKIKFFGDFLLNNPTLSLQVENKNIFFLLSQGGRFLINLSVLY